MYTEIVELTGPLYRSGGIDGIGEDEEPPDLAHRPGPREEETGDDPAEGQGEGDGEEHGRAPGPEGAGRLEDPAVDGPEGELAREDRVGRAHEDHHEHDAPDRVVDRETDRLREPVERGAGDDQQEEAQPDQEVWDHDREGDQRLHDRSPGERTPGEKVPHGDREHDRGEHRDPRREEREPEGGPDGGIPGVRGEVGEGRVGEQGADRQEE